MSENRAGIPLPGDAESSATLVELFSRAATRSPGRTALRIEGEEFGYGRLSSWSEAVAGLLHETGVRRGDRVALRMRPGANAIAAVLGILRAGAAYVPLDTRNPP
ncbi:AMP-binding protein, partial [Streptomyces fradiae]